MMDNITTLDRSVSFLSFLQKELIILRASDCPVLPEESPDRAGKPPYICEGLSVDLLNQAEYRA